MKPIQDAAENWWRQGMMGATNAHYLGIKVFSETDFTDDLKTMRPSPSSDVVQAAGRFTGIFGRHID